MYSPLLRHKLTSLIRNLIPLRTEFQLNTPHTITFCALRAEKPMGLLAKPSFLPFTQPKVKVKCRQQWGGRALASCASYSTPRISAGVFLGFVQLPYTVNHDRLKMARWHIWRRNYEQSICSCIKGVLAMSRALQRGLILVQQGRNIQSVFICDRKKGHWQKTPPWVGNDHHPPAKDPAVRLGVISVSLFFLWTRQLPVTMEWNSANTILSWHEM